MIDVNYVFGRDTNGNKVIKIKPTWCRGFSIQTAFNLPKTHRNHSVDESEIVGWVKEYGTLRQKEIFGWY